MKKLASLTATVLTLLTFSLQLQAQGTGENFPFSSYDEFDLERGYEPGSIIVITRKKIQTPIVTIERIKNVLGERDILKFSDPIQIPSTTLNRKKIFKSSLKVKPKYQAIDANIKATLNKVKDVTLEVKDGVSYNFRSGTIALQDIIYELNLEDLNKLLFEIEKKRKLYLVSEVIKYNDASLTFKWGVDLGTDVQATIANVIEIGNSNEWVDNGSLKVNYAKNQLVGYKAIKIDKKYIKLIYQRIEYRKKNGDDMSFFQDNDGDGYGDSNANPVKTIREQQPAGYVANNSDCDDNNVNLYPETTWYKDEDGDGYGNNEITTNSCSKPNGYVSNNTDCYDNNPNAFPGQSNYFTSARGDGSFDYDCNGTVTKRWTTIGACGKGHAEPEGWWGPVPEPGVTMSWLKDCDRKIGGTKKEFEQRTQEGK